MVEVQPLAVWNSEFSSIQEGHEPLDLGNSMGAMPENMLDNIIGRLQNTKDEKKIFKSN